MKIGIAGPITLSRLALRLDETSDLPRGYEFPLIADMVLELLNRGHEVSVFTLDRSITSPRRFRGQRLTVHVGRMRRAHRARDLYAGERADLVAAMRADHCDLIHAHWTYEFALAVQATGQPYVLTAHDSPLDNALLHRMPYWWLRAAIARRVVTPATPLSAVSPYIVEQYERFFRARRVRLIPNAVPTELLVSGAAPLHGGARPPTFATVLGGWDRLKNGVTALKAFASARSHLPDARLVMFGRGYGLGEAAHLYALQHSISTGVEFAGHTDAHELHSRLRSEVDILVHPARMESFGMVLIEAIACGVAVIAGYRSGAVPWTLGGGRCGVLVDIETPQPVAAEMVALARDAPRRNRLRTAATDHVSRNFAMPAVIAAYEQWYEHALTSWTRPATVAG